MTTRRAILLALVFTLLMVVAACKRKAPPPPPIVVDVTPRVTPDAGHTDAKPDGGAPKRLTPFDRACAAQGERNEAEWARAGTDNRNGAQEPSRCGPNGPYSDCVAIEGTRGWLVAVDHVAFSKGSPFSDCEFQWHLRFVDVDADAGMRVLAELSYPGYSGNRKKGLSRLASVGQGAGGQAVFMERVEIGSMGGDDAQPEGRIYVARGGAVVPHPDLARRNVDDVSDVDGDGRVDLILTSPFATPHAQNVMMVGTARYGFGPSTVAHALADGTYAFDDVVAKSSVRKACPVKPNATPPMIDRGDPPEDPAAYAPANREAFADLEKWITCEKFWGAPTAEVKKALASCKSFTSTMSFDQDDHGAVEFQKGACPGHLLDWTNVKVPFTLE